MCHKWPIPSFRLSWFISRVVLRKNMTGATCGPRTAYSFGTLEVTHIFSEIYVFQSFVFYTVICRSLFGFCLTIVCPLNYHFWLTIWYFKILFSILFFWKQEYKNNIWMRNDWKLVANKCWNSQDVIINV